MRVSRVLAALLLLGLTAMAAPVLAAEAEGAVYQITATSEEIEEILYLVVLHNAPQIMLAVLDSGGITWSYGVGTGDELHATGTMFNIFADEVTTVGPFDLQFTSESVTGTMQTLGSSSLSTVTGSARIF